MSVVVELSHFKVTFHPKYEYRLLYAWKLPASLGRCVYVCDLVGAFVMVHGG